MKRQFKNNGSILIFSIWVMLLLAVFAFQIGVKIRQRVTLISRLEQRSALRHIAEAGIKKAIAAIRTDFKRNGQSYTSYGKQYRHNNEQMFKDIPLGRGYFSIRYPFYNWGPNVVEERYGFVDEESKINLNAVPDEILARLIQSVLDIDSKDANKITEALVDWRSTGKSQITGFYSDDFYNNLEYPYEPKNAPFEMLDELLLVQGITPARFDKLQSFLTVYGNGQVNINTASPLVLSALGFSPPVIDKILSVRRGPDNIEATADDYIFQKTFDIASDILQFTSLEVDEIKEIDAVNETGWLKVDSVYFYIESEGRLSESTANHFVARCIYNAEENIPEYWLEK